MYEHIKIKEEYSLKEERKKIKDKCIIDETKSIFKFEPIYD